jgi:hypothetical protein
MELTAAISSIDRYCCVAYSTPISMHSKGMTLEPCSCDIRFEAMLSQQNHRVCRRSKNVMSPVPGDRRIYKRRTLTVAGRK